MEHIQKKQMDKDVLFTYLLHSVKHCDLCQRMGGRRKVLSSLNGNIHSKVLFVAEAPGRLGAECTGIPLFGDKTGENFETLLSNIGWNRSDVFITNSILCNPQDNEGNNSTPTPIEIDNCSTYLSMTIDLIKPDVVVTLGVKALESLKLISDHKYVLSKNAGELLRWNGMKLFPLYHMGPRALIHRNIAKQRADFIKLSHIIDPIKGLKQQHDFKKANNPTKNETSIMLGNVLKYLVDKYNSISMFKATKLMYLADLFSLENFGKTITGSIYLRMQDGPWIPTLKDIAAELESEGYLQTRFINRKTYYISQLRSIDYEIPSEVIEIINRILEKYENYDDALLKTAVYMTSPMRYILNQEKNKRSMIKIPVLYQNKTVIDLDINK